jgi:hypothetical protein
MSDAKENLARDDLLAVLQAHASDDGYMCVCERWFCPRDGNDHAEHLADVLEPLIAKAQAEALREAVVASRKQSDRLGYPYSSAEAWLLDRANELEAGSS